MLEELLSDLRIYLYDIEEPYRYSDGTLIQCLYGAVKLLGRRWRNRYYLVDGVLMRNPNIVFKFSEPPVISPGDEYVFIVQAAIILKSAVVYDSAWDVASWKDDEVSYSNIQGAKSRDDSLRRDLELLEELLRQTLIGGIIQPLPGFHAPYNKVEGSL